VIGLIWAQAANGVIGRDGTIPWHVPEDFAHFRACTTGATVVMGRRTWESLPDRSRPLPGRRNLVLTRQEGWRAAGAEVHGGLAAALAAAGEGDVWVIGGTRVYAQAMPLAERIELTELAEPVEGDAVAPPIGPEWQQVDGDPAEGWHTSRTGVRYRWRSLRRTGSGPGGGPGV